MKIIRTYLPTELLVHLDTSIQSMSILLFFTKKLFLFLFNFIVHTINVHRYYTNMQLTVKSDVYSFGVVLLELVTGRLQSYGTQSPLTSLIGH